MDLPPSVRVEALDAETFLIIGAQEEAFQQASWGPVRIPSLKRFLALGLCGHFMTSPSFGDDLAQAPDRGQFLLWEQESGRFGLLLPVLYEDFRAEMRGCEGGLEILCSCGASGRVRTEVALAVVHLGGDPFDVVNEGMKRAAHWMKRGRLRVEKVSPRWMEYLGWCTWDAFYTDVDENKVLEGLKAFQAGGIVPGQIIIDEGWQDATPTKYLKSFGLKPGAFTEDRLASLVHRAKCEFGVVMAGCWRTLFGQLRGVDVESPGLASFQSRLVQEPGTESDTFGVIEPGDVARFHDEYAAKLAADGVDFIKVDFQSALHLMTYGQLGRAEAARLWQHGLQDSVAHHFHGEMLNCMSLGSDEVYHTRISNVARASDDYFPTRDDSHPGHIRQNLYNALWLAPLQWPDWDMFQSRHLWAFYHAVGRAISGGPVYVSDKPGQSDYELLKRFVAADGKVLRCDRPALPTRDTLFCDPVADHSLIKAFNRCGEIGLLAVFHPHTDSASSRVREEIGAWQAEGLGEGEYAVYSLCQGFLGVRQFRSPVAIDLACAEADLVVFSPIRSGFAPLGLVEKINPPAAIVSVDSREEGVQIEARGGGRFGFFCQRAVRDVRLGGLSLTYARESGGYYTFDTGNSRCCQILILHE